MARSANVDRQDRECDRCLPHALARDLISKVERVEEFVLSTAPLTRHQNRAGQSTFFNLPNVLKVLAAFSELPGWSRSSNAYLEVGENAMSSALRAWIGVCALVVMATNHVAIYLWYAPERC
ncbi:hypothetical protein [Paraburkholderia sp. JHI869]|uniref:hypothetical protein n=1 Tax=Paraburkholderia sp. JHI869 TaxID=3112959 RepID=UPI00316DC527